MPRISNTFVPTGEVYAAGSPRQILDLRYGGQMGWAPDFTTYVNNHPFVTRPLICLMLEEPKGFQLFPNSDRWIGSLRSMIETKPLRIEGLRNQWEVETASVNFGGGGQEQEVFTDVKESKPDISFTWTELDGMPIYRMHKAWINYLMMNPHTKYAMNNTIPGAELSDLLPDQYAMTCAFIEPDPNHRYVNQAWIVTNMFPKGTGDNSAKRDKTSAMEVREVTINYTGLSQQGDGVNEFAQMLLDRISIAHADPEKRRSFIREISARVAERNFGYGNTVDLVSQERSSL